MIHIQLEDGLVAALTELARSRGLSLEEFLAEVATHDPDLLLPRVSGEEAVRLIESEASPGNTSYKGTYSRDDIYLDHD